MSCGTEARQKSAPRRLQLEPLVFWSNVLAARDPLEDLPPEPGEAMTSARRRQWTFATANVLTFCPKEEREQGNLQGCDEASFRRLQFARVLASRDVQIAGVQEARTTWTGAKRCEDYWVFASGAQAPCGSLGVELWVHCKLLGRPEDATVVETSPRVIVVLIHAHETRLACTVAHAHTPATSYKSYGPTSRSRRPGRSAQAPARSS